MLLYYWGQAFWHEGNNLKSGFEKIGFVIHMYVNLLQTFWFRQIIKNKGEELIYIYNVTLISIKTR